MLDKMVGWLKKSGQPSLVTPDEALMLGRDPKIQARVETALQKHENGGAVSPLRRIPLDLITEAVILEISIKNPTNQQLQLAIERLAKKGL